MISTAGAAVLLLLLAVDCEQTVTIFRNPHRWRELNPLISWLASHARTKPGKVLVVRAYFACVTIVAAGLLWLLWSSVAAYSILVCFTLAEFACVVNNWKRGIRL